MFAHLASTLARARANGKAAFRGSGNPQYSQTTVPDPPAEGRAPANDGEEMLVTLDDTSPTCWIAEAIAALPTGGGRVHLPAGVYRVRNTIHLPANVSLAAMTRSRYPGRHSGCNRWWSLNAPKRPQHLGI